MQRDKVLPPLFEPLSSSRIANFQDYAQWDRQRKEAYRNQLQEEMQEHGRSRECLQRQKERDRAEINAIVWEERSRNEEGRHLKIKTEQKYMQDNWTLLQHSHRHSPRRLPNPEAPCGEHPFVRLVDGQEQRQLQTKRNFIFQNKLNGLQSEMKQAQAERRRLFESQERRLFEEHVEDQYRKKRREREQFESKYLKIDKNSDRDCKKEYLEYLKAQAALTRSQSRRQALPDPINEVNRASPGNIGLSPASYDRIKQLETIQKSLKLFHAPKQARNRSTLEYRKPKETVQRPKAPIYEKMPTERAAPVVQLPEPLQTLQIKHPARMYPIQSQLSERLEKPTHSLKPYKQYNIINGTDRIFLQ